MTRPGMLARRCRRASGITATSALEIAPAASGPSTAEIGRRVARPRICSVTSAPLQAEGPMPNVSAAARLRPIPPGVSALSGNVAARPSRTARLTSVPARSTVTCRPSDAITVAGCSSSGAACLTPGIASTLASIDSSNPSLSAERSCRLALPTTACTTWPLAPAMLLCATVEASTNATAMAMPKAASNSETLLARRRRRYM